MKCNHELAKKEYVDRRVSTPSDIAIIVICGKCGEQVGDTKVNLFDFSSCIYIHTVKTKDWKGIIGTRGE